MRNVQSKTKGVMNRKARGALASWLLTSTAVLGLLATNNAVAQTCAPPPPNMVSWWPGDGNANDIRGSNNGTLQNGATFVAGEVGQAFSFDGIDDYVQTTDTGLPFGATARTLDFWMQPGLNARVPVIYGDFVPNDAFYILVNGANACIGQWGGGPPGEPCGSTNVTDGNWHHVAMAYDGGSNVLLYVDGALETSVTKTYTTTQTGKLYMGSTVEGSQEYYAGLVDEVEIFSRALLASEIEAIFDAGSAGKCRTCTPPPANMVSWWPGDGNANDIQGSSNGTLQGDATFAAGKVGQAFSFSSDGDGVVIPHNSNLNPQSPGFTAGFWMKGIKNQPEFLATMFEKSHGFVDATGWAFQVDTTTGAPRFAIGNGSGFPEIIGGLDVLDGNFHFISGAWDGSTMWLYVDGIPQGTAPNSTSANNTRDLNIGFAWGGGTRQRFFRGILDELGIFHRALSASEIQAIYNASGAGECKPSYAAQIQQPINGNGTSIFSVRRGVVPVKFTLTENGTPTCALPPATIAVTRTSGGTTGQIDESIYTAPSDSGSNFRIDSCQYIYNLSASALGVGTYRIDIKINNQVVGSATFQLK